MGRHQEELAELRTIKGLVGQLKTRNEFVSLADYIKPTNDLEKDTFKLELLHEYIKTKDKPKYGEPAGDRTFTELLLFQILDKQSDYFIPDQKLDFHTLNELPHIARTFVNLAGRNAATLLKLEGERSMTGRLRGGQSAFAERRSPTPSPSNLAAANSQEANTDRTRDSNGIRIVFKVLKSEDAASTNDRTPQPADTVTHDEGAMELQSHSQTLSPEPISENRLWKLETETAYLKSTLSDITSPEDIISASRYLDRLISADEDDEIKAEAFRARLNSKDVDPERVWREFDFYRLTGETASTVIAIDAKALDIFDEPLLLAQRWTALAASGKLGKLEQKPEIKAVKEREGGATIAQQIGAYRKSYRREEGFDNWTWTSMSDARSQVVQLWQKHQRKRPLPSEDTIEKSVVKRVKYSKDGSSTASNMQTPSRFSPPNGDNKPRLTRSPTFDLYDRD